MPGLSKAVRFLPGGVITLLAALLLETTLCAEEMAHLQTTQQQEKK